MTRHRYFPITTAPTDGTPIIAVCGGVECIACWHDPLPGVLPGRWYHYDDEEMAPSHHLAKPQPTEWRPLFAPRHPITKGVE